MMKISAYALTIALITHKSFTYANAACGTSGTISSLTAGAACTFDNFEAGLTADCSTDNAYELLFVNVDAATGATTQMTQAEIQAEVEALCEYDAPTQFVEISGTYQKDRRYFAGSGIAVDGNDWDVDLSNEKRFSDNACDKTMIKWPEYAARLQYNTDNGYGTNGYPTNMNLNTSCALKTAMCCFTDSAMDTFPDGKTTDVCRHDLADSPQSNHIANGWSVFPGSEAKTYCTGFTWKEGEEELLGNMMYDISYHNTVTKGYRAGIPGAPMCGCIEHMPTVEKASCRTASKADGSDIVYSFSVDYDEDDVNKVYPLVSASNAVDIVYEDCADTDLATQFKANHVGDNATRELINDHLVGDGGCSQDLEDYLNDEEFLHEGRNPTRYIIVDSDEWSDLFVGEGSRFQPLDIEPAKAESDFRALLNAGCTDDNGDDRYCIIRRVCDSCSAKSHRDIYYKRLTPLPESGTNTTAGEVYFLDLLMNQWVNQDNDMDNGDFQLFSTYDDALNGTNAWTYCNYNYPNVGFPRDCGPKGYVHNEWNSYVRGGGYADHHGFYVELS